MKNPLIEEPNQWLNNQFHLKIRREKGTFYCLPFGPNSFWRQLTRTFMQSIYVKTVSLNISCDFPWIHFTINAKITKPHKKVNAGFFNDTVIWPLMLVCMYFSSPKQYTIIYNKKKWVNNSMKFLKISWNWFHGKNPTSKLKEMGFFPVKSISGNLKIQWSS